MPEKGKLHLLPTLLSADHYEVIPQAVSGAINELDYFLVENIRTARRYISGLNLGVDISSLNFEVVDKNTPQEVIDTLLKPVENGISAGIMSESGCPGIADPGARIVARAHQRSIKVIPYPGPSSIFMGLMASGFNGQRFSFHGYLPIDKRDRAKALLELENESRKNNQTQIFIETPYRNMQMLEAIIANCSQSTRLCIARDITGKEELVRSASISEWKKINVSLHKVPAVFLLYSGSGI